MVLDMTPILSGKCTCIPFEFDFRPEPDSYVQEVFSDLQYPVPMHISGMVTDQAGYMSLHAQVIVKYVTACARCAEPVDGEKQFSFENYYFFL